MAKGISIKFKSYEETVPKILQLIKLDAELKKHEKIVLKPALKNSSSFNTSVEFAEQILKYCLSNKNPDAKIFIAEGSEGENTMDMFEKTGYKNLSEKYSIGLIDLNNSEIENVSKSRFAKFETIKYPKILLESFVISLPVLAEDPELEYQISLSNMIGAFPASHYKGLFSKQKNKIRNWPIKYSLHDLILCKMPELAIIDASNYGAIIAGVPFEMDKQAMKLLGKEWKTATHLRLISESLPEEKPSMDNSENSQS